MDLAPGVVVAERYFVDRKIGTGGMAEVWGGQHLIIGCRVAIKRLLPAKALRHDMVTRFKREAFFLGRVESDYVARVLDFVTDPALGLVLVMEFVEGEPLSNVLRRRKLTVEEALELGADLASALVDLHKASIVHRDLKPANVILRPLPDGRTRAVVVDFGVSRLLPEGKKGNAPGGEDTMTRLTRSNVALGTIEYMAPEQVLNSRDATERSDLYAVGAILYRAVAGRHVFGRLQGGHLARTKISVAAPRLDTGRTDKLAVALGEVVDKALKRRPAERHASAQALLDELGPLREIARLASLDVETTFGGEETRRMSVRELLGEALAAEHADGHALALDDADNEAPEGRVSEPMPQGGRFGDLVSLEGRPSEPVSIDESDLEPAAEGELGADLDAAPETGRLAEDSVSTDPQPAAAVEPKAAQPAAPPAPSVASPAPPVASPAPPIASPAPPIASPAPLGRKIVGLIDDDSADEPTARHDASVGAGPASSGPPPLPVRGDASPAASPAAVEASPPSPAAAERDSLDSRPAFDSRPALESHPSLDVAARPATAPPIATTAEPRRRPPTLAIIFAAATLIGVLIALLVFPARQPPPGAAAEGASSSVAVTASPTEPRVAETSSPGAPTSEATTSGVEAAGSAAPMASAVASSAAPSSSASAATGPASPAGATATAASGAVAALTAPAPRPKLTGRLSDLAPPPSASPSGEARSPSTAGAAVPTAPRPAATARPDPDVYE